MFQKNILQILLIAGFFISLWGGRLNAQGGESSRAEHLLSTLADLKQSAQSALREKKDLLMNVELLKKHIEEYQSDLKVAKENNDNLNAALEGLKSEEKSFLEPSQNLKERIQNLSFKKISLEEEIGRHETEIAQKNTEKESLKNSETFLRQDIDDLKGRNESLKGLTQNPAQHLNDLKAILKERNDQMSSAEIDSRITNVSIARAIKDELHKEINLSQGRQGALVKEMSFLQQVVLNDKKKIEQLQPEQGELSKQRIAWEEKLKVLEEESARILKESALRQQDTISKLNLLKTQIEDTKKQKDEFSGLLNSVQKILNKETTNVAKLIDPLDEKRLEENAEVIAGENDALKVELDRLQKSKFILLNDKEVRAQ